MIFEFRFRTEFDGVVTQHAFSAGPHYDPDLVSFGPVIGCDLHSVAPGAGFDWHAHAGVVIVSLVLDGTLRHEDSTGEVVLVSAGEQVLVQHCDGGGIRHRETNASDTESLRFVQTTLLLDTPSCLRHVGLPVTLARGVVFGAETGEFRCGPVVIATSENRQSRARSTRTMKA